MPTRFRSQRVEAIVLRHQDWGEADRLLGLYTREAGKLRAIVKGARKLRSRKAGHLEPFTRVQLMLARGRDLWIVTQVETVDAYMPLREVLQRHADARADIVDPAASTPLHTLLSDREYEVFQLLGTGKTVSEIAHLLSLSVPTISTYRARILEKMKMDSTSEIIHYAVRNRLVE